MKQLISIIAVTICILDFAYARIGESINEVNDRYGKPTFSHNSEFGTYARYKFNDREIEVIFVDNQSKVETIHFARERLFSHRRAEILGQEVSNFIVSLLTNAYDFINEKALEVYQNPGRTVAFGRETATYTLDFESVAAHNVFIANLRVQQSEMGAELTNKCNNVRRAGIQALNNKELDKASKGF